MEIERINHIPEIMKRKRWDRQTFIREAQYHARLSWPSAAKWADGSTEVELDTLERLAVWLGLPKDEILESRPKK